MQNFVFNMPTWVIKNSENNHLIFFSVSKQLFLCLINRSLYPILASHLTLRSHSFGDMTVKIMFAINIHELLNLILNIYNTILRLKIPDEEISVKIV